MTVIAETGVKTEVGQYNPGSELDPRIEDERFEREGYKFEHRPLVIDPGTGEYPRETEDGGIKLRLFFTGALDDGTGRGRFFAVDPNRVRTIEHRGYDNADEVKANLIGQGWKIIDNTNDPKRFIAHIKIGETES